MKTFLSKSRQETFAIGKSLASSVQPGDCVALIGDLGSGKTLLVAGACEGLGVHARVGSPTFTFINEYPAPFGTVAHIDLYRIATRAELEQLGLEEYFNDRSVCFIEWAERTLSLLPNNYYLVNMAHGRNEHEREITIEEVEVVPA